MINVTNLDIAVAEGSFFIGMIVSAYCIGQIYDWWYARKKRLITRQTQEASKKSNAIC
jgi:hypothetical protein